MRIRDNLAPKPVCRRPSGQGECPSGDPVAEQEKREQQGRAGKGEGGEEASSGWSQRSRRKGILQSFTFVLNKRQGEG